MRQKLSEKYRPTTLDEVFGQPPVTLLKALVRDPYECCIMLDGPPGCGKTAAACALAHDLGCVDRMSGLYEVTASSFSADEARKMLRETLRMRPLCGAGWKVLVLEELEFLSPTTINFLKPAFDKNLPPHTIVVATSNDTSRLGETFLERFKPFRTFHAGKSFAVAAQQRLLAIWLSEGQSPERLPSGWQTWGWCGERFSMRIALGMMQDHLTVMEAIG